MVLVDPLRQPREDAELSEQEARVATMPMAPSASLSIVADGSFFGQAGKAAVDVDFENLVVEIKQIPKG